MSALIPINAQAIGSETIETVNARELHQFLGPKARFNDWIARRIASYGFEEGRDFTVLKNEYVQNQGLIEGTESSLEYHISLDMAKELSMVERTKRGKEARQYFLACERALKAAPTMLPPTYQEQIGKMQAYVALAESLGMLEDRDRLMVKDMARTLLPLHLGLSPVAAQPKALTEAGGFFLSDRVRALGYCPTRKQEATLMSKGLAREVSKEYRDRHGEKPPQSSRFVDGAVRPVFWYTENNAAWIDPLIQTWCARVGIES